MDDELAAIRAARLQELQRNAGGGSGSSGQQTQQQQLQQELNSSLLSQVLEPAARERLSRVRLVKPDRVVAVENYLTKLVQMGQLRHKLSEDEIVEILDGISRDSQNNQQTKITFSRRQIHDEDEDDEDDFFD